MSATAAVESDPLRSMRGFPPARWHDAELIAGNVPPAQRQLSVSVFENYFCTEGTHGCELSRRLRWLSLDIWPPQTRDGDGDGVAWRGEAVAEIEVTPDMCDVQGRLATPCAIHLMDMWSVNAIGQLGISINVDASGVSQSLNTLFHRPAYMGQTIRLVGRPLAVDAVLGAGTCEIYEKESGELIASCAHTIVNPARARGKL